MCTENTGSKGPATRLQAQRHIQTQIAWWQRGVLQALLWRQGETAIQPEGASTQVVRGGTYRNQHVRQSRASAESTGRAAARHLPPHTPSCQMTHCWRESRIDQGPGDYADTRLQLACMLSADKNKQDGNVAPRCVAWIAISTLELLRAGDVLRHLPYLSREA